MTSVAFIGLGAMGSRMARLLLDAGHDLVVWNRTPDKALPLTEAGARLASAPSAAAHQAEVVITMVADPSALRDVTEGPEGIAAGIAPPTTVIEMSTVGTEAVTRLRQALPEGVGLLDAPVLGSLPEAESGNLSVFAGGPQELVERWMPLLSVFGRPMHVGPLGSGAAAKLTANSVLLGVLGVLGEALALAQGLGLSLDAAFKVLTVSPLAAQAERRRHTVEANDYSPPWFKLSLARKDAELVAKAAEQSGVDLRLAPAALSWLADAERASRGEQDYSAVLAQITSRD